MSVSSHVEKVCTNFTKHQIFIGSKYTKLENAEN